MCALIFLYSIRKAALMMKIKNILMGWAYISKLQPPMDILFTLQVICEHGEPHWQSYGSKQEEWAKGMINLALQCIFVHTCK
jgi:hypothetical protein